jgi:hypothetical protein
MFLPSKMVSIALFGGLVAFTVFMALVADFIILPAILELTRPLGAERHTRELPMDMPVVKQSSSPAAFPAKIDPVKT